MSDNIINLRQARKNKARTDRTAHAEENRRKHGRTKAERLSESGEQRRALRHIDGHQLERSSGDNGSDQDE